MEAVAFDPLEGYRLLFANNLQVAAIYATGFAVGCYVLGRSVKAGLEIAAEVFCSEDEESDE